MKRLCLILFVLLLAAPAMAGEPVIATEHSVVGASAVVFPGTSTITLEDPWTQLAWMNPAVLGSGGSAVVSQYCDTKTGYLLCEDFEGSTDCDGAGAGISANCRYEWTARDSCATEPDYAYTAGKLAGTYSVYFNETAGSAECSKYKAYTTASNVYSYFRVKFGVISSSTSDMFFAITAVSGSNIKCAIGIVNDSGTYYFAAHDGTAYTNSSVVPSVGTEYHIWVEFVRNTSCSIYVSETSTKPETASAQDTSGVSNSDAADILLKSRDGSTDLDQIVFDNILVDDATIGSQ